MTAMESKARGARGTIPIQVAVERSGLQDLILGL